MDVDVDESSTSVSDSDHRGSIASLLYFLILKHKNFLKKNAWKKTIQKSPVIIRTEVVRL